MSDWYFLYTYETKRYISVGNLWSLWPQHRSLQNQNGADGKSCAGYHWLSHSKRKAAQKEDRWGVALHSDQGFHHTSHGYFKPSQSYGILLSMSIRGNCRDNALAENFLIFTRQSIFISRNLSLTDLYTYEKPVWFLTGIQMSLSHDFFIYILNIGKTTFMVVWPDPIRVYLLW